MKTVLSLLACAMLFFACQKELQQVSAPVESKATVTAIDTVDVEGLYKRTDTFAGKQGWNDVANYYTYLRDGVPIPGDFYNIKGYRITRIVLTLTRTSGVSWKYIKFREDAGITASVRRNISQVSGNTIKIVFEKGWDVILCNCDNPEIHWFAVGIAATGTTGSSMSLHVDSIYFTHHDKPVAIRYWTDRTAQAIKF